MRYPILIHKDPDSDYGVTIPDLPGCFSAGGTLDEALQQASEAIACHVEALMLDGEPIPLPKGVDQHRNNPDYADGIWALVAVDVARLSGKTKRINITLPERLLAQMDSYATQHGATRSGLIAEAAIEYLAGRA